MKLDLEIITPTEVVFKDEADEVIIPTVDGEIAILPNHVGLLTKIKPGELTVKKSGKEIHLAITGGFLEINENKVSILADYAVRAENIEIARAEEARQRAERAMKEKGSENNFLVADAELRKSLLELKVARKYKPGK